MTTDNELLSFDTQGRLWMKCPQCNTEWREELSKIAVQQERERILEAMPRTVRVGANKVGNAYASGFYAFKDKVTDIINNKGSNEQ